MMRRSLLLLAASAAVACGGGGSSTPSSPPLSDPALYAQAVLDYNAKAYATAKAEFQELLNRPSATAYYDKSTVYIAAIDYHQGLPATCLQVLGSPTAPLSGFFLAYPGSTEMDRARYWHGRCEMGITPPDYLAARADFTAVIGMAAGAYTDNAYFWRGRTFYATALATGSETSADWSSALSDFSAVVSGFTTGTVAPEAKYWMGRTHFTQGDLAKGRGTLAGDAVAQAQFTSALNDLGAQPAAFPGNTWIPDVNVYIGRTHLEQASYLSPASAQVTAYAAVVTELSAWLGTTAPVRDEANYWYGRAIYERGAAEEAGAGYAAAQSDYAAAQAQFQKFQTDAALSTSKLADNASFWVGRCLFSQADLVRVQADAGMMGASYATAQAGFYAAQLQFAATRSGAQFATSNILDLVQVYLGRSQYQQGLCAEKQMASGAAMYAAAQASLQAYFTQFGTPVLPSAAAAHYWLGRAQYAQASLAPAIASFDAVVAGWDWFGIATSAKPTTVWWDNSQYYLVLANSDLATAASCGSAQTAYDALKGATSPTDPLVQAACPYMKSSSPLRCPANVCP